MLSTLQHLRISRAAFRSLRFYSTAPSTEELRYPEGRSPHHHDLSSYLDHASRIALDQTSNTYKGTHYEYTVLSSLERLGMSLRRIGGAQDYGIDLLGTWSLPSLPQPVKVLIQCKRGHVEPAQIRELEGAFIGAPEGWKGPGVLAFLVSQEASTKGHRAALRRSRWPMGYISCQADGKVLQMLWNRKVEEEATEGISVEMKYTGASTSEREVILTRKGEILYQ